MSEKIKQKLDLIHNLQCPVCGIKPKYKILDGNKFKTEYCGHSELEIILTKREQMVFNGLNPDVDNNI